MSGASGVATQEEKHATKLCSGAEAGAPESLSREHHRMQRFPNIDSVVARINFEVPLATDEKLARSWDEAYRRPAWKRVLAEFFPSLLD